MLATIITGAYKNIVGDLDLKTATPAMLEEQFRTRGKAWGRFWKRLCGFISPP